MSTQDPKGVFFVIAPVSTPSPDRQITHTLTRRGFGWAQISQPGQPPVRVRAYYYPATDRLFVEDPDGDWIEAATGEPAVLADGQPYRLTVVPFGVQRLGVDDPDGKEDRDGRSV